MTTLGGNPPDPVDSIAGFVLLYCDLDLPCLIRIVRDYQQCPQSRLGARIVYWARNIETMFPN
jgi:hypothetical protein